MDWGVKIGDRWRRVVRVPWWYIGEGERYEGQEHFAVVADEEQDTVTKISVKGHDRLPCSG